MAIILADKGISIGQASLRKLGVEIYRLNSPAAQFIVHRQVAIIDPSDAQGFAKRFHGQEQPLRLYDF